MTFGIFVLLAYPISGGCLNPAIGFSITLVNSFIDGANSLEYIWIYLVFPLLGSLVGITVFECCYRKANLEEQSKEQQKVDDSLNAAQ